MIMTRLLIVQPDQYLRGVLSRVLERGGYVVQSAVDEVDSLALLVQQTPDAIVLDLFPQRRAWTRIGELYRYARGAAIPVIGLVSGHQSLTDDARALFCDAYVGKPFDLDELLDQVAGVIGVPALGDQREYMQRQRGA
jgi:CheY-like chemotaxis protein